MRKTATKRSHLKNRKALPLKSAKLALVKANMPAAVRAAFAKKARAAEEERVKQLLHGLAFTQISGPGKKRSMHKAKRVSQARTHFGTAPFGVVEPKRKPTSVSLSQIKRAVEAHAARSAK